MKNFVIATALAVSLCLLPLTSSATQAAKTGTSKPKAGPQKTTVQKTATKRTATHKAGEKQTKPAPKKHTAQIRNGNLTSGEASSLETKEASLNREEHVARVDNRGRVTSASHAKQHVNKTPAKKSSAKQAAKKPVAKKQVKPAAAPHKAVAATPHSGKSVPKQSVPAPHAASLKTGQLTSSEAAKVQIKETSAQPPVIHDGWSVGDKPAPAPQQEPSKTSPPLHLPQHNARMF